ncbi:hypothetical protein DL95DRAFT_497272 [Leptodontidium sp. 2 PMI_412]|nr:hypothetical protein DL95DRAFT_497272 [Leptodontidium sp. 2 PMI_412]
MGFHPLHNGKGEYGPFRDHVSVPPSPQRLLDQPPPAMGTMEVDYLNARHSPKNATTTTAMPVADLSALNKTMDSVIDDQPSYPRNPKKVRFLKAPKPIAPDYNQKKDAYFVYLINDVKYEKFANDAQALNPHFIKRSSMETLWYKTLKNHYANSNGLQTGGYEGFDANRYWELQNMVNGMEGMSVAKEVDPKPSHFRAMETARRRRKAEVRLAATKADQSKDAAQDTAMEL